MKRAAKATTTRPGVCRICGCTDARACAVGCSWMQADLCSVCDDIERAIIHAFGPRSRKQIEDAVFVELDDLVEEGDCDRGRIRKALADLTAVGALARPSRTTYALPEGGLA